MARRPQPRTRNSEATQQALLEAGARLFAEIGYEAATLEMLAAGAGVTKAMVRYHFEDKAGLYRAVIAETLDHVAEAIGPVRDSTLAPRLKLSRYIAVLAGAIRERPHIGSLLSTDYSAGRMAKDEVLITSLKRMMATTTAILEEGRRAGEFRKLDPHTFHLWIVGSISFYVTSERFRAELGGRKPWSGQPRFEDFVRLLQDLALRGVATNDR